MVNITSRVEIQVILSLRYTVGIRALQVCEQTKSEFLFFVAMKLRLR